MNVHALPSLRWTTASFAATEHTTASDLSSLGEHFQHCSGCQSRWFSIECAIEAVHAFVGPRIVTTLFAVGAVIGVGALVL